MTKFFQLLAMIAFVFAVSPLTASAKSVGNTDSEPPKECGVLSDADRAKQLDSEFCKKNPNDCVDGVPKAKKVN